MTRRDMCSALASVLMLGGCNKSSKQSEGGGAPPQGSLASGAELQLDYAIVLDQGSTSKPVPGNYHFRSGDRFRVQLRPQFAAHVYLANRSATDKDYSFLFPHSRIPQANPLVVNQTITLPGEEWYTLDSRPGLEHMVLLASTHAIPDFADTTQQIPRDDFETRVALLERDRRPASSRHFEDHDWVKLFASYRDDTVLVVRLPLDHT